MVDLGARGLDAMELAIEGVGVVGQARRDERAADAARAGGGDLALVEAEIGQHAADALGLELHAGLDRIERRALAMFEPVERGLQPAERAIEAAALGGEARRLAVRV